MITLNNNIQLLNILGKGRCGVVFLGKNIITKEYYAIKKIPKILINTETSRLYFKNEIKTLKMLNHPNIVKFKGLAEDADNYYLLTEYINGGSLEMAKKFYFTKYNKPLNEKIVKYFISSILNGLMYMNKYNIIHRDIKGENILLHYNNDKDLITNNFLKAKVKIIDFGFSRFLRNNELAKSIIGSPLYMDPSILTNFLNKRNKFADGFYDKKVDIWSLGVLTYKLLLGNLPFKGDNLKELIESINNKNYVLPQKNGDTNKNIILSENAILFIDRILNLDNNIRPSANVLIRDKWFINTEDINNKRFYCLKSKDEIKSMRRKNKFFNFWKIIKKDNVENKKKKILKIVNITRLHLNQNNSLSKYISQFNNIYKNNRNERKIIKIEEFDLKNNCYKSTDSKDNKYYFIKKINLKGQTSFRNNIKINKEFQTPKFLEFKRQAKSQFHSAKKNGSNFTNSKMTRLQKINLFNKQKLFHCISYINKKINYTESNNDLKKSKYSKYFYNIPKRNLKTNRSRSKKISITDHEENYTQNYNKTEVVKSL